MHLQTDKHGYNCTFKFLRCDVLNIEGLRFTTSSQIIIILIYNGI